MLLMFMYIYINDLKNYNKILPMMNRDRLLFVSICIMIDTYSSLF